MLLDFCHNRILEDALTENFKEAFKAEALPLLSARYGMSLLGVQMYEDYLSDEFLSYGRWFYPLTVLLDGGYETCWISWNPSDGNSPYTYYDEAPLEFALEADVPPSFVQALEGRRRFADAEALPVKAEAEGISIRQLSGMYSQSFIDEMAVALTRLIEENENVRGLSESGLTLLLVFSAQTFMEHTAESVTYRRLVLTDGGRTRRDFWVMWERTDGKGAYTMSDCPDPACIRFSLGTDVPQAVRQKEYRYLLTNKNNDTQAYTRAMGRRNVTDWHDLIKKAVKAGALTVLTPAAPAKTVHATVGGVPMEEASLLATKLNDMMAETPEQTSDTSAVSGTTDDSLAEALRRILADTAPQADESASLSESVTESAPADLAAVAEDTANDAPAAPVYFSVPEVQEWAEEEVPADLADTEKPVEAEDALATEDAADAEGSFAATHAEDTVPTPSTDEVDSLANARIRVEQERLEAEKAAREHAEIIARLTEEQQNRAAEILRLTEKRQKEEEEVARLNAAKAAEEQERLRRMEEDLTRREANMRERITDDVKRAFAEREQRRMEEEARLALEAQAKKRAQEEALDEERRRLEDARAALEAERVKTEQLAQAMREAEEARRREAEEARRREEAKRQEEARLHEEERRLQAARAEEARLAMLKKQAEEALRAANERHEAELLRLETERIRLAEEARRLDEEKAKEEAAHKARLAAQEEVIRQQALLREAEEEKQRMAAAEAARAEQNRLRMLAEEAALREDVRRSLDEAQTPRTVYTDDTPPASPAYTFGSYVVHMQFDRSVDPNIQTEIRKLIENTVQYFKKETVPISVRCTTQYEQDAVKLHFYRMPKEEYDLLIHIIKVLGNSALGVKKIVLEEENVK